MLVLWLELGLGLVFEVGFEVGWGLGCRLGLGEERSRKILGVVVIGLGGEGGEGGAVDWLVRLEVVVVLKRSELIG